MKSVLIDLLFVWGTLVPNNTAEFMCSLLHWISGLYVTHLDSCLFFTKAVGI